MARRPTDSRQMSMFGNNRSEQAIVKAPQTLERVVLNTTPGWGFEEDNIVERMQGLFRMRSEVSDDLNFRLVQGAFFGFEQMEWGDYGVPHAILEKLSTSQIVSMYYGIGATKGRVAHLKIAQQPIPSLIKEVAAMGYAPNGDNARNAIRAMVRMEMGSGQIGSQTSVEERMRTLSQEEMIRFMSVYSTPLMAIQDPVNIVSHRRNGETVDSSRNRGKYVEMFVERMRKKYGRNERMLPQNHQGQFVASNSIPGVEYYVQSREISGKEKAYQCSCPHGLSRVWRIKPNVGPCEHIKYVQQASTKKIG